MKKKLLTLFFVVTFFALSAVSASALSDDTVVVGLRYGSTAMFSANLENALGCGFTFGYFDDGRYFEALGRTDETAISMTAAGDIYMSGSGTYSSDGDGTYLGPWHVQIDGFRDYDEALNIAGNYGGYPAWVDWGYVVRVGCYGSESEAAEAASRLGEGYAAKSSSTGVMVTVTRTTRVLFEFDCGGVFDLAVQPEEKEGETSTWFKGYKYSGAFEYPRVTGGDLNVYNVLDLESYVKGVIPYEMNGNWPLEALKAQAVCARTYACRTSKHRAATCAIPPAARFTMAGAAARPTRRSRATRRWRPRRASGCIITATWCRTPSTTPPTAAPRRMWPMSGARRRAI